MAIANNKKLNSLSFILYCFIILISIAQVAKSTIFSIKNSNNLNIDLWSFSDLLINYDAGFVRRGLIGSIVKYIDSDGILFDTVLIVIFVNFLIFIILVHANLNIAKLSNFQKLMFHVSVFSFFNMALYGSFYARKEIFIINIFLTQLILIKYFSKKIIYLIVLIFGIISILVHEGIGFFILFPFNIYILSQLQFEKKQLNYFRLVNFLVFILMYLNKGNEIIVFNLLNSFSNEDLFLFSTLKDNAITVLNEGIINALRRFYVLIFSGTAILWSIFVFFIPISIQFITGENLNSLLNKIKAILFYKPDFLLIPLLFVLGWDWGRWLLTLFYFLLFIILGNLKNAQQEQLIFTFSNTIIYIVVSLLTVMPICCLELSGTRVSSNYYRIYKSVEITIFQLFN